MNSYKRLKLKYNQLEAKYVEALRVLTTFKNALTVYEAPRYDAPSEVNGSIMSSIVYNFSIQRNKIHDEATRKEMTKWIVENIDKDIVKKWMEKEYKALKIYHKATCFENFYDNNEDYQEDKNSKPALGLNFHKRIQNSNDTDEWFVPLTEEEYKLLKEVKEELG